MGPRSAPNRVPVQGRRYLSADGLFQLVRSAVERMMEARPVVIGLARARDVVPGMSDDLLLHAPRDAMEEHLGCLARGYRRAAEAYHDTLQAEKAADEAVT